MISEAKYEECGNQILGLARCVDDETISKVERILKIIKEMNEIGYSINQIITTEK
ncbi:MAG: hypothetical protein GPJ50_06090 [Candidatus Heimdallarchaeota archaeon]|nr:hypothetical protein [Candidatus Heimdallarchaeota archaeon]